MSPEEASRPILPAVANPLAEPLIESAPFALEISHLACRGGPGESSCAPYHGFWQYLRLLGLGKTMSGFSAEFATAIRDAARAHAGASFRVLISGCADYSAYAHVLAGCAGLSVRLRVTAVDLCPTPLILSRWYARRHGGDLSVVRSDILDHRHPGGYDLILTSSFLGYFPPALRSVLFARYAELLAPGGRLIFTTRLRPGREDQPVPFGPEQKEALVRTVVDALPELPGGGLERNEAVRLAVGYADLCASHPVNGEESLRRLADGAGLRWLDCDRRRSGAARPGVSGPTVGAAEYLFVTLGRPA
ncbi:class I SAM-dependent methyltransferase [Thauera sp.]|jgi:SAM-dependent methyltransferase|uniref:class I SAM-dependent methyltransferase n=1 Tax=Thauera sp. TaxID=1905334 RepID=UPI002C9627EC|nr:class I SAM-dependent methyltransferase [Thauera sp.]HRO35531.1 class I SAM-dependent methyltransferase [Thauera sp.]